MFLEKAGLALGVAPLDPLFRHLFAFEISGSFKSKIVSPSSSQLAESCRHQERSNERLGDREIGKPAGEQVRLMPLIPIMGKEIAQADYSKDKPHMLIVNVECFATGRSKRMMNYV